MSRGDPRIDALVADLTPVRRAGDVRTRFVVWLVASHASVFALTWATGPFRPGAVEALLVPRFGLETALGLGSIALAGLAALSLGIPGLASRRTRIGIALTSLGLWLGVFALALLEPALEPTMAGKREGCEHQTLLFGLPPLLLGLALLRSLAPLDRARTGALLGAAAGAIPAALMQLACMYDPTHALTHHVAPVLGVVALGALLGPIALRRI